MKHPLVLVLRVIKDYVVVPFDKKIKIYSLLKLFQVGGVEYHEMIHVGIRRGCCQFPGKKLIRSNQSDLVSGYLDHFAPEDKMVPDLGSLRSKDLIYISDLKSTMKWPLRAVICGIIGPTTEFVFLSKQHYLLGDLLSAE